MTDLIATARVTIAASPKEVWTALTDPALIERYYFGAHVESAFTPGSPISWSGEYEGTPYRDHGTILEARPGEVLSHTHFSPLSGREDVPENYHTLTYRLEPEGESTVVTLTQDNNESYDAVAHSEKNWSTVLEGLKGVLES
jgi:uncharacterized protein YndB with AHSA1/START domain